jgi:hypothetical protein
MSAVTTHGVCGKSWTQRVDRTGHCAKCHETFEGLALFDAHQAIQPDGSVICHDPAVMVFREAPLRLVGGMWRGQEMPKGTFAKAQS